MVWLFFIDRLNTTMKLRTVMSRTDRLRGLVNEYSTLGGLFLAYLQFIPSRLADVLSAPLYAGYQIAVLFAILLGIILGIYYLVNVMRDEADRITETITEGEFLEMIEDIPIEGDEEVATDGGKQSHESDIENPVSSSFIDRFAVEPSGKGALIGIAVGGIFGLVLGSNAIIIGGIIGGILGNELEYQSIKKKRRSLLGLDLEQGSVSQDLIFDVLKNRRRRYTLELLGEHKGEIPLTDLSKEISKKEANSAGGNDTELRNIRKSVYTSLHQTHLSKLAAADFIEFDDEEGMVRKGPKYNEIEPYLGESYSDLNTFSNDVLFDALKNRRRRYALQILLEEDGPIQLSELSERIASLETGVPINELSAHERKSVYTSLYQTHLPKLHDVGFVDYNSNRGIVKLGEQAENLESINFYSKKFSFSWNSYYLITSLTFSLIYVLYKGTTLLPDLLGAETLFLIYLMLVGGGSVLQYRKVQ